MEASELIERLEKATGPDREIDADLHLQFGQEPNEFYKRPLRRPILLAREHQRPGLLEYVDISGVSVHEAPRYTASLDAALALVERVLPGTEWAVSTLYGRNHAEVNMNAEEPVTATGATLPIALCLALLKAVPNCPPQAEAETVSSRGET